MPVLNAFRVWVFKGNTIRAFWCLDIEDAKRRAHKAVRGGSDKAIVRKFETGKPSVVVFTVGN